MIKIKIGEDERLIDDIDAYWINQEINFRRLEGQFVCVIITIHEKDISLVLATTNCPHDVGGGSTRLLTPNEEEVGKLWNRLGLNKDDFSSGNVVAFLKQFRNSL